MAFNDTYLLISPESECESDGSLTPEHIYTTSGHVLTPEENELFSCYNHLLDEMQGTYNEIVRFHKYNADCYTFVNFCETVKKICLNKKNKKNELIYLTSQQCNIHNHVLHPMLDKIANETASCVSYSRVMKLFLFCYKVVDIISAS